MSLLVWNCHELGNQLIGKELEELVQAKDLFFMIIVETWIDKARLDRIQHYINFEHKRVVECSNWGGELILFWKSIVNLIVEDISKYYIDAFVDKDTEKEWRFTSFYGELETCT